MTGKANFANRTLYISDNLPVLRGLNSASVDLVYLDPPFNSKREYKAPIGTAAEGQRFNDTWRWTDLDNRWLGEIDRRNAKLSAAINAARQVQGDGTAAYLTMMGIRLLELRRVLKKTGSLYLHCDPAASHYLKLSLDAVFGKAAFRSEVVWKRTSAHSGARRYGPIHDTLFFYAGERHVWNKQHLPYDEAYLKKTFRHADAKGGRYKHCQLTGPGLTAQGSSGRPWRGYAPATAGRHWALPSDAALPAWICKPPGYASMNAQERLDVLAEQGMIYFPTGKKSFPLFKRYLSVMKGMLLQDVFLDIPHVKSAKERTGWATQKPLDLLRRIIKASSNPGDLVLDPFAGCATCCVAAEMEGRRWMAIEECEAGADIIQVRLDEAELGGLGATRKVTIMRQAPRRTDAEGEALAKKRKTKLYKTDENFNELYGQQRGLWNGCGEHFRHQHLTFDHITPQVRDGGDEIDNLQLLCTHCNSTKGEGTMDDLRRRLKEQDRKMQAKREAIGRNWQ